MNKILLKIFIIDKDLNEENIENYNKQYKNRIKLLESENINKRIEVRKYE